MKPHIEQTIADLNQRIGTLQIAVLTLTELAADGPVAVIGRVISSGCASNGRERHAAETTHPTATAKPARRAATAEPGRSAPTGISKDLASILPELPAPFDARDVQQFMQNFTVEQVRGALSYAFKKGHIKMVTPPSPKRGGLAKYARPGRAAHAAVPVAKPIPVKPTAPADRAKLESDLAAALKQRDHARQNGRDSIVEIFQRDIDNIESKLASL